MFGNRGKKLLDNHLHKILCHLPEDFEQGPLDEISCEPFEAYIAKILKINVNNQKVPSIFRLLEFAYEDKHTPTVKVDYCRNKNDVKLIWLQNHLWEPLEIAYDNTQVALLISDLNKYQHIAGEDYLLKKDSQNKLISIIFPVSSLLNVKN